MKYKKIWSKIPFKSWNYFRLSFSGITRILAAPDGQQNLTCFTKSSGQCLHLLLGTCKSIIAMNSTYFQGLGDFHAVRRCSTPPLPAGRITVLQAVATWSEHFNERGVTEPEHSSQYIISHLLGAKTVSFLFMFARLLPLPPVQAHGISAFTHPLAPSHYPDGKPWKRTVNTVSWQGTNSADMAAVHKASVQVFILSHLFAQQLCTRVT